MKHHVRGLAFAHDPNAIERERGDASGLIWNLVPLLRSRQLREEKLEEKRFGAEGSRIDP